MNSDMRAAHLRATATVLAILLVSKTTDETLLIYTNFTVSFFFLIFRFRYTKEIFLAFRSEYFFFRQIFFFFRLVALETHAAAHHHIWLYVASRHDDNDIMYTYISFLGIRLRR